MPETPIPATGVFVVSGGHPLPVTLLADDIDALITAQEATRLCGVQSQTIRKWATRGYTDRNGHRQTLTVAGLDPCGHKLFKLIDVARAEHDTRLRARRAT